MAVSEGHFHRRLRGSLGGVGSSAPGLSASTITRLKEVWGVEAERWQRRDLTAKRYVYFWVDGIYFSARMEEEKRILVIVGATDKGQKELIAIADGYRESEQSWLEVLLDLRRADRRAAAVEPPYAVEGVLPAHRLVQARRRPQGHDGQGRHAGHAQGRPDRPAGAAGTAEPARPGRSSSGLSRTPKRRCSRPRRPSTEGPSARPPLCVAPSRLLRPVVRGTRESKLWNEFVARYHYLGYKTLVGAQMRYAVHDRDGWPLAMLGFSTAAWKLAPRDNFIGWTRQLREKNLPFVVDNPRFLILPWINIPNLGSHILAIIRRRLPDDWTERYNTTPVLIETFVETPRYTGAVYKASGWTRVGTTQGRGRYDRDRQSDKPKKDQYPQASGWIGTTQGRGVAPAPATGLETHPQSLKSAGANGNARADSTA